VLLAAGDEFLDPHVHLPDLLKVREPYFRAARSLPRQALADFAGTHRRADKDCPRLSPLSARQLADKAGAAESTIKRMEQMRASQSLAAPLSTWFIGRFEAGIVFLSENGGGVGVRLCPGVAKRRMEDRIQFYEWPLE
jgi:hypothetical protein